MTGNTYYANVLSCTVSCEKCPVALYLLRVAHVLCGSTVSKSHVPYGNVPNVHVLLKVHCKDAPQNKET